MKYKCVVSTLSPCLLLTKCICGWWSESTKIVAFCRQSNTVQNGTQSVFFMRRFAWQAFHCDAYRQMTFCHPLLERRHFPRCFKANQLSGTQSQYINIVSTTAQQALSKLSSAETNNTSKQSYSIQMYTVFICWMYCFTSTLPAFPGLDLIVNRQRASS